MERPDRRRAGRRALAWGLGLSTLLHILLLIFVSRTWLPIRSPIGSGSAIPQEGRALPEMISDRLTIVDSSEPEEVDEVPELPDPEVIPPRRTPLREELVAPPVEGRDPGEVRDRGEEDAPPGRPATDRLLRPGMGDPRLWERADAPPEPEKSDLDRARERVYARIMMLNDSLAAEGAAADRATDWTFTDKDGKRWGISPGKVHLGGVTLPLPVGFSPPPDQAKEARERASRAGEIADHADRARVRGRIDEQIDATRAERDRARAAKRDSTKAGGTE